MPATGTVAEVLWTAGCEGVRADDVEPCLFLVDELGRAMRLTLGSAHPLDFLDALELRAEWSQIAVVTAGHAWAPDVPGVRQRVRVVVVVDRAGSSLTLQAPDGQDLPDRLSGEGGRLYAAMVAALVPAGELDRELSLILDG